MITVQAKAYEIAYHRNPHQNNKLHSLCKSLLSVHLPINCLQGLVLLVTPLSVKLCTARVSRVISCCSMPSRTIPCPACPACHPRNLLRVSVRVNWYPPASSWPLSAHLLCSVLPWTRRQITKHDKPFQNINMVTSCHFLRPCLVATFFGTRLKAKFWLKSLIHPFLMPQRTHTMPFPVTWLAFWMCCLALSSSCSPLNSFRPKVTKSIQELWSFSQPRQKTQTTCYDLSATCLYCFKWTKCKQKSSFSLSLQFLDSRMSIVRQSLEYTWTWLTGNSVSNECIHQCILYEYHRCHRQSPRRKVKRKKMITHATHATKPKDKDLQDLHVFFEASKFGRPSQHSQLSKSMSKRVVELYQVVAVQFPLGSSLRPLTQDWLLRGFRKPKVERCRKA